MADHFPFSTDDYPAHQGTEITEEQFQWANDMAFRAGQSIAKLLDVKFTSDPPGLRPWPWARPEVWRPRE